MAEYVDKKHIYDLFEGTNGVIRLHVAQLDQIPAADVVEVVRCRDCKYISEPTGGGHFLCGRKMLGFVRPDDFCSFGAETEGG